MTSLRSFTIRIATTVVCMVAGMTCAVHAQTSATDSLVTTTVQQPHYSPFTEHFSWGVDIVSGVDLTAHDMTMLELSASAGYKNSFIRFAGVGASILSMMNNSSRCYPVYAMLRTSFSKTHQLCFLELKAGVAFSSILDYGNTTNVYGSVGLGVTLAHSRRFSSHVLLRGVVIPLKSANSLSKPDYDLYYASIGLGCAF